MKRRTLANEWKDPRPAKHLAKIDGPCSMRLAPPQTFLLAALVVVLRRDHERVRPDSQVFA